MNAGTASSEQPIRTRPPLVEIRNLTKTYSRATGEPLLVLDRISLDVPDNEILIVVGESGSGKSTLLHILGTLDRPDSGDVLYRGENVLQRSDEELAAFRNRSIGFVFQFHHLLPEFTAVENVAMPALIGGQNFVSARPRAMDLLDLLGIADRSSHRPHALSGGEQQRVAVARALMNSPTLVLADEPSGNLDTDTAERLHDEIARLSRELGQTFVIATHSERLADRGSRVLRLENHTIFEQRRSSKPGSVPAPPGKIRAK